MTRPLTADEFSAELASYAHTAFRLEQQPEYLVDMEGPLWDRWRAGDMTPPTDTPAIATWLAKVATATAEGRRMTRVRVQEEPPTEYQQWQRWFDQWNTEAGEQIDYLPRSVATEIGLLPDAGPDDWWLLDSSRLLVLRFDGGRVVGRELVTDPERVVKACAWRDLATHYATPGRARVSSA